MSNGRILVVEDESVVAMHLQRALQKFGYETLYASSAAEALKCATAMRPDLVMMDIMLGGPMDGISVAELLRSGEIAPVVYLTAYTDAATLARARQTQPMGYLVKPFREPDLQSTIEIALFRSAAEKRLLEKGQLAEVLLESLSDGIVRADRLGRISLINSAGGKLFGRTAERCMGLELASLFENCTAEIREEVSHACANALQHGNRTELRGLRLRWDGEDGYQVTIGATYDGGGHPSGLILIVSARSTASTADAAPNTEPAARPVPRLPFLSEVGGARRITDAVTGLPTRAEAGKVIANAFAQKVRLYAGVLVVERFRCIAERFGATAADELLVFFSVHLAQSLSSTNRLYRWTGPSFVVLTADESCSLVEARHEVANLASVRLEPFVKVGWHTALVPLSARYAVVVTTDYESPEAALVRIDAAAAEPDSRPVR